MTECTQSAVRDDGDLLGTGGFCNAEEKREHECDMRQLGGLQSSVPPQFRSGLAVPPRPPCSALLPNNTLDSPALRIDRSDLQVSAL